MLQSYLLTYLQVQAAECNLTGAVSSCQPLGASDYFTFVTLKKLLNTFLIVFVFSDRLLAQVNAQDYFNNGRKTQALCLSANR